MLELLGSFVAGILTTLAPCVLPLLPVIVAGSVPGRVSEPVPAAGSSGATVRTRPDVSRALMVTASLGASIVAFTLLLRASTALIGVPPWVWSWVSGGILVGLGLVTLFPNAWDRVSAGLGLQRRSSGRLSRARSRDGLVGAALTGAALGPVFSSCSPFYAYVVATVVPAEPARGVALLAAYVMGLCGTLLLLALAGQGLIRRLGWLADPHGYLRRGLGVVVLAVGIAVLTGWDRDLQAWVIEHSPIRPWELDEGFVPGS